MNKFHEVREISREQLFSALSSNDVESICEALVAVAFHEKDWHWAQELFLSLLSNSNSAISGLAAVCLGHLARIHRKLEKEKVVSMLRQHLEDPEIGGRVSDALDDIDIFLRQ